MRRSVIALTLLLAAAAPASAQSFKRGIGVIFGDPTGINFKYHIDPTNAIDAAAAWSLSGNKHLHLQADYLFHNYNPIKVSKGRLPVYYGIGGRVVLREDKKDLWGIRIPLGLDYYFSGAPFDIFAAIVPVIEVLPDTDFDIEGSIGFRFWF